MVKELVASLLGVIVLNAQTPTVITIQQGQSMPNPIPAGTTINIVGTYSTTHTSPNGLKINGTPLKPVVIRSANPSTRSVVTGAWEVTGSHYTIENLVIRGGINQIAPNINATIRYNEFSGNGKTCGGWGLHSYNKAAFNRVIRFFENWVHDQGDLKTLIDQDCHGGGIGENAEDVWISGNLFERNSGDGVQINSGNSRSTRRIYVVENLSRNNKQYGFWSKQATDVVFSRNTSHTHRPSNSSVGACIGAQYGPEQLWITDNTLHDCDYGVHIASDIGDGNDGKILVVMGNTISNIRDTNGDDAKVGPIWASAAISLMGGTTRIVSSNNITTSTRDISVNGPPAHIDLAGMEQSLRDYYLIRFGVK